MYSYKSKYLNLVVVIVAFRSELSSEIKDPAIGSTIVFDNVPLNLSDAYNPANGVFVAKVAGVYVFHLTASSPPATGNHVSHSFTDYGVANVVMVYAY